MDYYPYRFEASIDRFGVVKTRVIWYSVVFLTRELQAALPFGQYPRLRVEGEINEVPIENAFLPTGDGRHYLIVSPRVMKEAAVEAGDKVRILFRIADQNRVEVPQALQSAIDKDTQASEAWTALTPGKKRMLAQHVLSAKTPKTRAKRVVESLDALIHFRADLRAWRKARSR
ncbi:MAG: YdeI/OmpD-associated family protein [Planctomycetota bacterium]